MLKRIFSFILEALVQKKGNNVLWINWLNTGIHTIVSGARFTKERITLWKHILTASRDGDVDVRKMYVLNMFLKTCATIIQIGIWMFFGKWFFTEFSPFSYMDLNGNFWHALFIIGAPMMLYAFALGQLDWFGSDDAHEDGTIVAESLPFKWIVSIDAGVTEELRYRGATIFLGLSAVYISNLFFDWIILAAMLIACIAVLAWLEIRFIISAPIVIIVGAWLLKFRSDVPMNIVYTINEYIFTFFQWMTADYVLITAIAGVLMFLILIPTVASENGKKTVTEVVVRTSIFVAWCIYCLPLGIDAIAHMPILPAQSDHLTYLLYIGAVLWSNAKFRDGHKYQGPSGLLHSYVAGIYMFYIAFTHGLMYAIVLHVLFDAILFTSEHLCQVIKNRRMIVCNT